MLPRQVMLVRELGDAALPYWTAAAGNDGELILESREKVLWTGFARVGGRRPAAWRLPDATALAVTDRRTVFHTTAFDKGGGWVGFGVGGLLVATTANVVSKRRAARRSAGKVAIGQVRHEWVRGVQVREERALVGAASVHVDLDVSTAGGPQLVELWGGATRHEFARWLARVVAHHRLALAPALDDGDLRTLERYADGACDTSPATPSWTFPGDPDSLAAAAFHRTGLAAS